jgi:outer membrane protein OmpA-like peptidoglycan-associated protein
MKISNHISLVILAALSFSCANVKYNTAEHYYKNKDYANATKQYEKLAKYNNESFDITRQMADAYHQLHQYNKAEKAYEKAILNHPKQANLYYQMALVMKMNEKCAEGNNYLQQYITLEKKKGNDVSTTNDFCQNESKTHELYTPKKVNISSGSTFLSPVRFNGRLYFLTKLKNSDQFDICSVNESDYSDFEKLKGNVNTVYSEGPFTIDRATNEMYVTRQKMHLDEFVANKNFVVELEILKAKLDDDKWKLVDPFKHNLDGYSVGHPSISEDGKILVFASNQPGTIGETDLFISKKKTDGTWEKPTTLPTTINSIYKEVTPSISQPAGSNDYVLSFASDRPPTNGGLDLYTVHYNGKTWGEVWHHEHPVNSSFNEYSLTLDHANSTYLLTSDRDNAHMSDEVFQFDVSNRVEGILKDKKGKALNNQELLVTNITTGETNNIITDRKGKYQLNIKQGVAYKLETISEEFEPALVTLNSDRQIVPVIYDLDIITSRKLVKPIEEQLEEEIALNQIYFDYNKASINEVSSTDLIKLYNTLVKYAGTSITVIGHADSRGDDSYNRNLSQRRSEAVVDWLITKGIKRNRLSYQGRGEDELVNHCKDDVPCSDEEHEMNRRTTFIVNQTVLVNN